MTNAPTVFAQIMAGLDPTELARAAVRFPMPRASKTLRAYDHFAAMVFAQLTYRESLRGIEACLTNRPLTGQPWPNVKDEPRPWLARRVRPDALDSEV